jgi:hypothetical protein
MIAPREPEFSERLAKSCLGPTRENGRRARDLPSYSHHANRANASTLPGEALYFTRQPEILLQKPLALLYWPLLSVVATEAT